MPVLLGRMHHFWNWCARDIKTKRLKTFFTDGMGHIVTKDQLFAFVKHTFPYLDLTDFSCEPTAAAPQDKRALVAKEVYMDDWQLSLYRRLTDQDDDYLADAGTLVTPPKRSILHGSTLRQPEHGRSGPPDRLQRRVPILRHH